MAALWARYRESRYRRLVHMTPQGYSSDTFWQVVVAHMGWKVLGREGVVNSRFTHSSWGSNCRWHFDVGQNFTSGSWSSSRTQKHRDSLSCRKLAKGKILLQEAKLIWRTKKLFFSNFPDSFHTLMSWLELALEWGFSSFITFYCDSEVHSK